MRIRLWFYCVCCLFYDHYVDTLLYGWDNISLEDFKSSLNFRELKKHVLESYNDDHTKSLIAMGKTNNKGLGSRAKSISKSKSWNGAL
jgi:hypothetical protein